MSGAAGTDNLRRLSSEIRIASLINRIHRIDEVVHIMGCRMDAVNLKFQPFLLEMKLSSR
jgi:hypothetical protein